MADEIFSYKCADKPVGSSAKLTNLDLSSTNGLKCVWSYKKTEIQDADLLSQVTFSWSFNWDDLKAQGVIGFLGHITLFPCENFTFDVDLKDGNHVIEQIIPGFPHATSQFEFALIPYCTAIEEYDEMFLSSEKNDAILKVEDKKLHVNKAFLSYHSDFFSALFSSNYKEGQMDEIPIKDVSYRDLGLLFSSIYPKTIFPNDRIIEKLLELADRFMVPSAIYHVEYHLLNNSKIESERMIWMADKYDMQKLLEKMIAQLDSTTKAKKLKTSPGYSELSDKTKGKILDQLMKII